jgi:hypothetical protein
MALISYLCRISAAFASVVFDTIVPGVPLTLVIYLDEICPGNPLRPDKARTLQAVYWTIVEFPQHVLQRTACWMTFGTLRTSIVNKLPGGISSVAGRILKTFFPEDGDSFSQGITLHHGDKCRIVRVDFGGFLADDKALNEIADSKGASGIAWYTNNVARVLVSSLARSS